jgi:hypothetical protein
MVVADGVLTNLLIRKDIAREANPLLVGIAGEHALIILKVAGVLLCILIIWDFSRRNLRLAFWTSLFFLLVYTGIVAWNLHLLLTGI